MPVELGDSSRKPSPLIYIRITKGLSGLLSFGATINTEHWGRYLREWLWRQINIHLLLREFVGLNCMPRTTDVVIPLQCSYSPENKIIPVKY